MFEEQISNLVLSFNSRWTHQSRVPAANFIHTSSYFCAESLSLGSYLKVYFFLAAFLPWTPLPWNIDFHLLYILLIERKKILTPIFESNLSLAFFSVVLKNIHIYMMYYTKIKLISLLRSFYIFYWQKLIKHAHFLLMHIFQFLKCPVHLRGQLDG